MAQILENFTINRNILAGNTERSSSRVAEYIGVIGDGIDHSRYGQLSKGQTNDISALSNYTGLFQKIDGDGYGPTKLNKLYRKLDESNRPDAWQWLITRTLWHYVVPNGTSSDLNKIATDKGAEFNFFKTILSVLSFLEALSGEDRYLFFHELCIILKNDQNWKADAFELFNEILRIRASVSIDRERRLIDDLETEFSIPRDNFNTVLVKAFRQTGLFEYIKKGGTPVGIALSTNLSNVLQKRIRHILDTDLKHADPQSEWHNFIDIHQNDLPLEVEEVDIGVDPSEPVVLESVNNISQMCEAALSDFEHAGLRFELNFIRRFFAACLTKPFVILTGLSGSGKTKLAEAAAAWLSSHPVLMADPFAERQVIKATRTEYIVRSVDSLSVVLETPTGGEGDPKITTIPRALIEEWAEAIAEEGFSRDTPARDIRTHIGSKTHHDPQINAFESHLKACAFALIDSRASGSFEGGYKVVPVGSDWTSGEFILGYPDALNPENYLRRPALDLMLAAQRSPNVPHFLILDEMNLSHVERYFAEILSAIETTQPIELFSPENGEYRSGVPYRISSLPNNLFIVGTVNVDETTYQFSPKVLDRANVLEFRVSNADISAYMHNPRSVDLSKIGGLGAKYASAFLSEHISLWEIPDNQRAKLTTELEMFFDVLQDAGSEFGYRVAKEVSKFFYHYSKFGPAEDSFNNALDAQVNQKLLPKLHGAERMLKPILWSLAILCREERQWSQDASGQDVLLNQEAIVKLAKEAMLFNIDSPFAGKSPDPSLPISFEKCRRMNERLQKNGFTSYAEA